MVPTNDLSIFLKNNDSEFRDLVAKQCEYLHYPGSADDVAQDLYIKFIETGKQVEGYDEGLKIKLSTYLFKIIRNFILSKIKSHENRFYRCRVLTHVPIMNHTDELDLILNRYQPSEDYLNIQKHNNINSININGLSDDLNDFERFFSKSPKNVKYSLRKRKHKRKSINYLRVLNRLKDKKKIGSEFDEIKSTILGVEKNGCTLLDLYHLLYRGYTNIQIARIYGVSTTTISAMKNKLLRAMAHHGIMSKVINDNDRVEVS